MFWVSYRVLKTNQGHSKNIGLLVETTTNYFVVIHIT